MGPSLLEWLRLDKLPIQGYRAALEDVHELYGSLENVEQIVADLEDSPPGSPIASWPPVVRGQLRQSIRITIAEFFYDLLVSNSAVLYKRIALHKVRPDDAVITFNYDVACERQLKKAGLWEIGDGYGFSLNLTEIPPSKVKVLKLHGSANWLDMLFGGVRMGGATTSLGDRPVIWGYRNFESLGYSRDLADPQCTHASLPAGEPALIIGFHKRFYAETSFGRERVNFWEHLWSQAAQVLKASKEIVIIGYSMPKADEDARKLLLQTTNRHARIIVCCGRASRNIREEFTRHGFKDIEIPGKGHFEDYLS